MTQYLDTLKLSLTDVINQLVTMSPEVLTIVSILIVGFVLKLVNRFPNDYIPAVGALVGLVVYPLIADTAKMDYTVRLPWLRQMFIGLALWLIAWIIHEKAIKRLPKWLSAWLPKGFLRQTGDAEMIIKP